MNVKMLSYVPKLFAWMIVINLLERKHKIGRTSTRNWHALEGKKNEDSFKTPTPKKLFTPEASPLPSNASASPSGEVDANMPKQSAMPPPPPPQAAVTKACPPSEGAKASVPKPCPPKASPPGLMVATVAEDSADTLKDGEEAIAEELDLNHEDRRTVVSIVPCLFLNILFRMLFFL